MVVYLHPVLVPSGKNKLYIERCHYSTYATLNMFLFVMCFARYFHAAFGMLSPAGTVCIRHLHSFSPDTQEIRKHTTFTTSRFKTIHKQTENKTGNNLTLLTTALVVKLGSEFRTLLLKYFRSYGHTDKAPRYYSRPTSHPSFSSRAQKHVTISNWTL